MTMNTPSYLLLFPVTTYKEHVFSAVSLIYKLQNNNFSPLLTFLGVIFALEKANMRICEAHYTKQLEAFICLNNHIMVLAKCYFCSRARSESNFTKKESDAVQQCKYMSSHQLPSLAEITFRCYSLHFRQQMPWIFHTINRTRERGGQTTAGANWRRPLQRLHPYSCGFARESRELCSSDGCTLSSGRSASGTKERPITLHQNQHHRSTQAIPKAIPGMIALHLPKKTTPRIFNLFLTRSASFTCESSLKTVIKAGLISFIKLFLTAVPRSRR